MRYSSALLLSAMLLLCGAFTASADVSFTGDTVHYDMNGVSRKFSVDDAWSGQVLGSDIVYVGLDEEQAGSINKKPVLFFFDKTGAFLAEVESDDSFNVEQCSGVSLSPKGNIVALDNGTWVVRSWQFRSFPQLTPLSPPQGRMVAYLSSDGEDELIWLDNDSVLISTITEAQGMPPRNCGYEPCGYKSLAIYHIGSGASTPLLAGSDLCDYDFDTFDGKTVTARKTCTQRPEDWGNLDELETLTQTSEERVAVPGRR